MVSLPVAATPRRHRSLSPARVAVVTLVLVAAGGLLGGLSAAIAIAMALSVRLDWSWLSDRGILVFAGIYGAVVGGILAPLVSWVFLRAVPLGKAMFRTTVAAAIGGAIGGVFLFVNPLIPIAGAVFGFLVEAANLYLKAPRDSADATSPAS